MVASTTPFVTCAAPFVTYDKGYLIRANTDKLLDIFLKYTTIEQNGKKYITNDDFVRKFLGLYTEEDSCTDSVNLIAGIVDTDRDGLISFSEFLAFEGLLCLPDALYKTAFQLFDRNGNGVITFDGFQEVMKETALFKAFPIRLDSAFMRTYFSDKKRALTYKEFSQFLHDFHDLYWMEAYYQCDKEGTGYIRAADFRKIVLAVKKHLLTKDLEMKVINTTGFLPGEPMISFPYYMAFSSLLNNMELIKRVYLNATNGSEIQEVTKEQLMHYGQMKSQITPLEIDILFALCNTLRITDGLIVYSDLVSITPEQYYKKVLHSLTKIKAVQSKEERSVLIQILENLYRFTLGGVAGAVGAICVYPIDLVKTRVQNQRQSTSADSKTTELMYKNLWDCFKKTLQNEGAIGLYKGLPVQIVGVAPEKAVKLSVNDFVRDKLTDKEGNITVLSETLAGCSAGFCQVVITNPLEIVKIRLQVSGEVSDGKKVGAWSVIKELGLKGLYKGALTCMTRDILFSGIYFPVYTMAKRLLANESGYNNPMTLFMSGTIAGMPAAFFATPADVVKTRQQVIARSGQTKYKGIVDTTAKILYEEGPKAFFKGGLARVLRSSPQFGVTLAVYEILQRLFFIDFAGTRPFGSDQQVAAALEISTKPHHIGGYQAALPVLHGLETNFGISLPRWSMTRPKNPGQNIDK